MIDTATDTVVATVAAGGGGIAITPDGTRAYVVSGTNAVAVIDTATNAVIATVTVAAGTGTGIAITPDGTRAYVVPPDSALRPPVSVIDTDPHSSTYNTVVATVVTGATPFGVAVTPNGARVYVTNIRDGTVSVIDTASNTVVGSVTLSPGVSGIAISPDGTRAYVASDGPCCPNFLTVLDTATNSVIASVGVEGHSVGVALTPDGAFAYVGNRASETVSVVDTTSNTVVATVNSPFAFGTCPPFGLAITPDGTRVYVPCQVSNVGNILFVIDTATKTVLDRITVGGQSFATWVAFAPFGGTSTTGSLAAARESYTATVLPNGKVLIAGGWQGVALNSAELYDPATRTFASTGAMATARYRHPAVLLPNGQVLIAGGLSTSSGPINAPELYDPATGTFSPTRATATGVITLMSTARDLHTMTLLPNGKVLIAGGSSGSVLSSAELYDPVAGTFTATGSMPTGRIAHTATLLPNGKVLLAGGFLSSTGAPIATAVLYDPVSETFTATGSMTTSRVRHTATLMPNGRVLMAGGESGAASTSAEVYDPATETFSATRDAAGVVTVMNTPRQLHAAAVLPNGKVLIAGGADTTGFATATAELFDPTTNTFTTTDAMDTARHSFPAVVLPDGRVLAAGGANGGTYIASAELYCPDLAATPGTWAPTGSMGSPRQSYTATRLPNDTVLMTGGHDGASYVASAEVYNPATGTFSATGSLSTARGTHTATLLPAGKVLIAGGFSGTSCCASGVFSSAELYDPAPGTFSLTGPMGTARVAHSATLLPDGKVLVAGGVSNGDAVLASAELYDPVAGTFSSTGSMGAARESPTAILLPNGKVLVVGGFAPGHVPLSSAELYDPATGTFSPTSTTMTTARGDVRMAGLGNGKVLIAGGLGTGGARLSSAELYDPDTNTFTATGSMDMPRFRNSATLLPNGRVLIAGGEDGATTTASAELYDSATGTFAPTGSMISLRHIHTATLLATGKVLVAGGLSSFSASGVLASAELYSTTICGPEITFISPTAGVRGSAVTIHGFNFGATKGTSTATFNGVSASVSSWSDTQITATVPGGAPLGSGPVIVTVNGVQSNSHPFTVTNSSPIANNQSVTTNAGTPVTFFLSGSDPDGDTLTFSIVTGPSNGALSHATPILASTPVTYTPATGFSGPDSLTFKTNDGTSDSNIATVSITVAPQDVTPPSLTSLSFTPIAIDVTAGSQQVTLTAQATDNLSGVQAAGGVHFRSSSGAQLVSASAIEISRSGTPEVVTFQAVFTFPQSVESGTWVLQGFPLSDKAGNFKSYTTAELQALGFNTTLQVTSTQDVTPPTLVSLSFTPTTIDTTAGSQQVTLTAQATDNLSGVQAAGGVHFRSPSGAQLVSASAIEISRSGTPEVVTFQAVFTFPQYAEAGTWVLQGFPLSDRAGNFKSYTTAELKALGFNTLLTNTATAQDLTTPTLVSLSFTPTAIDTSTGSQPVTLTAQATDNLSGVQAAGGVHFRSPSGAQLVSGSAIEISRSGTPEVVTFRAAFTFPQFAEQGVWVLQGFPLSDRAGNFKSFSTADLRAAGFPTLLGNATGAIAGTVTSANPGPIAGAIVDLFDATTNAFVTGGFVTDATGAYNTGPLLPGIYKAKARVPAPQSFVETFHAIAPATGLDFRTATPVSVAANQTATADIVMPHGGRVSGQVLVRGSTTGIANATVVIFRFAAGSYFGRFSVPTNADGNFEFVGLRDGEWVVRAQAPGHVLGYYGAHPTLTAEDMQSATPVLISGANTVSGVNLPLLPGGATLSGRITRIVPTLGPVPAGTVMELRGPVPLTNFITNTTTDGNGNYTFTGVAAGSYIVQALGNQSLGGTATDWYPGGVRARGMAKPVVVAANSTVTGIDFTVQGFPADQSPRTISGFVRSGGAPLPFAQVGAFDLDSGTPVRFVAAQGDGFYVITHLPPGNYIVRADTETTYELRWYNGQKTGSAATPVNVSAENATGINFDLPATAATISGSVTELVDGDPRPVAGAGVSARTFFHTPVQGATTRLDGSYLIRGLPGAASIANHFKIRVTHGGGYITQHYTTGSGSPLFDDGAFVAPGATGVDVRLERNATVITGAVRVQPGSETAPVLPVAGAIVLAREATSGSIVMAVTTLVDGTYTLFGLPAGDFKLQATTLNHATQWFSGKPTREAADVVTPPAGGTICCRDFVLSIPHGAIAGHVFQSDGTTPLEGAGVVVLEAATGGFVRGGGVTDSNGRFFVPGLAPGTYVAQGRALGRAYNFHTASGGVGAPTRAGASPISVLDATQIDGRDFILTLSSSVEGTVTYPGTATGALRVRLFGDAALTQVLYTTTIASPNFLTGQPYSFTLPPPDTRGIVPGTYYVEAFLDVNGNGQRDAGEPSGVFGGASATALVVAEGQTATEKGIALLATDLAVTKTAAPQPNGRLLYTITVTNNGPSPATGVSVLDNLPGNIIGFGATPSQGSCEPLGGSVGCSLGNLASGATATVTIDIHPLVTTLRNIVTVTANEPDPDPANNTFTLNTNLSEVSIADLALSMTDAPDPVATQRALTYRLTVTNFGDDSATGVTLTDTLPAGVTFSSATPSQGSCVQSGRTVTCSLGTINVGGGSAVTVDIVVFPSVAGSILNTASVAGEFPPDPNTANNTTAVTTTVTAVRTTSFALSVPIISVPPVEGAPLGPQPVGDLRIDENAGGALLPTGRIQVELPVGYSSASLPVVSTVVSNGLTLALAGPEAPRLETGNRTFSFALATASSFGPARLLVSSMAVIAQPGTAPGPVTVTVRGVPGAIEATPGVTDATVQVASAVAASNIPTINEVSPATAGQGTRSTSSRPLDGTVILRGVNFAPGAVVSFALPAGVAGTNGIVVMGATVNSSTMITVVIAVDVAATVAARDVIVTNPETATEPAQSTTLTGEFAVTLAPIPTDTNRHGLDTVVGCSRGLLRGPANQTLLITGTNFQSPVDRSLGVEFSGAGIAVIPASVGLSPAGVTLLVNVESTASFDPQAVTVINPDGGRGPGTITTGGPGGFVDVVDPATLPAHCPGAGLTAAGGGGNRTPPPAPAPSIGTLSPNAGLTGGSTTIGGQDFGPTAAENRVSFTGANNAIVDVTPTAASTTALTVTVPATAVTGPVTVTRTTDGQVSNAMTFTVTDPRLMSVTPSSAEQGDQGVLLTLLGSQFSSGMTVTFSGTGITVGSPSAPSPDGTSVTVTVDVAADAPLGLRNVTVTKPVSAGGGTATLTGGFAVRARASFRFALVGFTDLLSFEPRVRSVGVTLGTNGKCTAKTIDPEPVTLEAQFNGLGTAPAGIQVDIVPTTYAGTAHNEDCEVMPTGVPAVETRLPIDDFSISDASAASGPVNSRTVTATNLGGGRYQVKLWSWDWGGQATITVTGTSDGQPVRGELTIPLDTDGDNLYDFYERNATHNADASGANVLDFQVRDQNANSISDDQDRFARDGLSNFAKQRGVYLVGPATPITGTITGPMLNHTRLGAGRRHLFVRGRGFGDDPAVVNASVPSCGVQVNGVTLAVGDPQPDPRVATSPCPPFAVTEAYTRVGVDVHNVSGSFTASTVLPRQSLDPLSTATILDMATVVYDASNCSSGQCDHLAKTGVRTFALGTLAISGIGGSSAYAADTRVFKKIVDAYFHDRPYLHQADPGFFVTATDGRAMLAPITIVGDSSSRGADNGIIDSKETTVVDGGVTRLAGDTYVSNQFGLDLAATDATNDGCPELPPITDPTLFQTPCDPLAAAAPVGIATKRKAVWLLISHELGHAVGILHTTDPTDLMYEFVIDWDRNLFSGTAANMIQIHNGGQQ